jgi:hypothetical protein
VSSVGELGVEAGRWGGGEKAASGGGLVDYAEWKSVFEEAGEPWRQRQVGGGGERDGDASRVSERRLRAFGKITCTVGFGIARYQY